MPDEWKSLEVWRLIRKPSADPKRKFERVWECRYVNPEGRIPDSIKAAPGARPTGGKERLDLQYGDGMVVFRYDTEEKTRSCRIPRKTIGDTGSIFIYETVHETKGWQRVIQRWGATGPPAKPAPSLDTTPLAWVEGKYHDLLCTSTNLGKRDNLDEFCCYYIDPEKGLLQVEDEVRSWLIDEAERETDILESKFRKMQDAANRSDDEALWDGAVDLIDKLMDNAVPDVAGGTGTPAVLGTFVSNVFSTTALSAGDWTAGYIDSIPLAATGMTQGALETFSIGWKIVIYSMAINRLRKQPNLTSLEKAQLQRHKKALKDLIVTRAPVALADTINGSIALYIATNYGASTISDVASSTTVIGQAFAGTGVFASGLNIAVNTYIAARVFRQVHKSRKRRRHFKQEAKRAEELICRLNEQGEYEVDYDSSSQLATLNAMTVYVSDKLGRRIKRKVATGGVAIISALGGTAGLVAGVATLAAATAVCAIAGPVGWAFLGVALVGGIAIAGYMLHRRRTRKDRRAKLSLQGKISSPLEFAAQLVAFRLRVKGDPKLLPQATALIDVFLDSSKVDVEKDPDLAQSEIARHFK